MQKISIEQANELLSQIGVDAAVVADNADDVNMDELTDSALEKVKSTVRPDVEKEVREAATSEFTGKFHNSLRSVAVRVFNIPRRELADMDADAILAKCKESMASKANDNDWAKEKEEIVQAYEKQIQDWEAKYNTDLAAKDAMFIERDIDAVCLSIVEKLPRKGGDLKEQAEMLKYRMRQNYDVRINNGNIELYTKDGQPAKEGNKAVKVDDYAKNWAEKAGILVSDTRHITPAEARNNPNVEAGIKEVPQEFADDPMYQWAAEA